VHILPYPFTVASCIECRSARLAVRREEVTGAKSVHSSEEDCLIRLLAVVAKPDRRRSVPVRIHPPKDGGELGHCLRGVVPSNRECPFRITSSGPIAVPPFEGLLPGCARRERPPDSIGIYAGLAWLDVRS
jgi:hypothetical protein